MKLDLYLPSSNKMNSKWIRVETINLLENHRGKSCDLGVDGGFLVRPQKAQATKNRYIVYFINIENFVP